MAISERGGVPWEEIFHKAEEGDNAGIVLGKSGRRLRYQVIGALGGYELSFAASDLHQSLLRLSATVYPEQSVFQYTVRTRGYNGNSKTRHPDMRAADFVGDILDIAKQRRGIELTTYRGHWLDQPGLADNYNAYYENLDAGMSKQEAAQNTWDGTTMATHGFYVAEYNIFTSGSTVITIFKREL